MVTIYILYTIDEKKIIEASSNSLDQPGFEPWCCAVRARLTAGKLMVIVVRNKLSNPLGAPH